jgi:hypothetical protein
VHQHLSLQYKHPLHHCYSLRSNHCCPVTPRHITPNRTVQFVSTSHSIDWAIKTATSSILLKTVIKNGAEQTFFPVLGGDECKLTIRKCCIDRHETLVSSPFKINLETSSSV